MLSILWDTDFKPQGEVTLIEFPKEKIILIEPPFNVNDRQNEHDDTLYYATEDVEIGSCGVNDGGSIMLPDFLIEIQTAGIPPPLDIL